jgi:hypothetical protein
MQTVGHCTNGPRRTALLIESTWANRERAAHALALAHSSLDPILPFPALVAIIAYTNHFFDD